MASIPELLMDKSRGVKRAAGAVHLVLGGIAMYFSGPNANKAFGVLFSDTQLDRGEARGIILLFLIPFLLGLMIALIGLMMVTTGRVVGERRDRPERFTEPGEPGASSV